MHNICRITTSRNFCRFAIKSCNVALIPIDKILFFEEFRQARKGTVKLIFNLYVLIINVQIARMDR